MSPRNDVPYGAIGMWLETAAKHAGQECLIWPFSRDAYGYGRASHKDHKSRLAHRIICEMAHGFSGGSQVRHLCGKGHMGCVNPAHLAWGNAQENSDDKILHGTKPLGEKTGIAKLNTQSVIAIKQRLQQGDTYRIIASVFGVSLGTIQAIKEGRSWRHVA